MRDIEEEARADKRTLRVGAWLEALGRGRGLQGLDRGVLTSIRTRHPTEEDPMLLLIVRASTPAGPYIAFVGASDLASALLAWRKRDGASGLKWRVDTPWGERREG